MPSVRRLAVAIAMVGLLGALPPSAAAQDHERARLAQTTQRLEAIQAEVERAATSVGVGEAALERAERQLAEAVDAVGDAQASVDRQQQAVDDARERVDAYRAAVAQRRGVLIDRAVSLYKSGAPPLQFSLLGGESTSQVLERAALVDRIAAADQRVIEEHEAAVAAERAQQQQLQREEAALVAVLAEQQRVMAQVDEIRDSRAIQLAERRSGLAVLEQQEHTLVQEQQQLASTIERVERVEAAARAQAAADAQADAAAEAPAVAEAAPPPAVSSAPAPAAPSSSTGWAWPTNGTVTSEYGYRWGRMHEGIDIAAPTGTPLLAARAGTVTFAGSMSGYGYVTLIDHGDGFVTAYAHQNRLIAPAGANVAQGEQIGEVGSSGRSTGPHVHFEIRLDGSPRNPRSYLP